jgi:hypothetical protein
MPIATGAGSDAEPAGPGGRASCWPPRTGSSPSSSHGARWRAPCDEYVVGRRVWDLGPACPGPVGAARVRRAVPAGSVRATLATVYLAIRDGLQAIYIDGVSGHASVSVVSHPGVRLPLHATGVGTLRRNRRRGGGAAPHRLAARSRLYVAGLAASPPRSGRAWTPHPRGASLTSISPPYPGRGEA